MKSNAMKKLIAKLKRKISPYEAELSNLAVRFMTVQGQRDEANALRDKAVVYAKQMQDERDQLKMDLVLVRAEHVKETTAWEDSEAELTAELKSCSDSLEHTREKLKEEADMHVKALNMIVHLRDERDRIAQVLKSNPDQMRAMLCQMRVFAQSDGGRAGYMVGTFLPDEVLDALKTRPNLAHEFCEMVWTPTLEYALKGIFHINSRGNVSAIIFTKLGSRGGAAGAVFDVDGDHKMVTASRIVDPTVRHIENQILAEQQGRPEPKLDFEQFVKEDAAIQTLLEEGAKQLPRTREG